jgi:hypothetical protein
MKDRCYGFLNFQKVKASRIKDESYVRKLCSRGRGTIPWLIGKELFYGGMHTNVKRNKVSHLDPRTPEEIEKGGMTGGDRMFHHFYAPHYARFLKPFFNSEPVTLIEIGILKGSGLAIWADLFPKSQIIGLDIDLENYRNNKENLKAKGGFRENTPKVFEFDQFLDNKEYLSKILNHSKVSIVIDDGIHTEDAILTTLKSVIPYLAEKFVYFIEDHEKIGNKLAKLFPEFKVLCFGELTVLTKGF